MYDHEYLAEVYSVSRQPVNHCDLGRVCYGWYLLRTSAGDMWHASKRAGFQPMAGDLVRWSYRNGIRCTDWV